MVVLYESYGYQRRNRDENGKGIIETKEIYMDVQLCPIAEKAYKYNHITKFRGTSLHGRLQTSNRCID